MTTLDQFTRPGDKVMLPRWPREVPYNPKPAARLLNFDRMPLRTDRGPCTVDDLALEHALRLARREERRQCGIGSWSECLWASVPMATSAGYTALASFTSEASLIAGSAEQPYLAPFYFDGQGAQRKTLSFLARGVLSSTGTPTYTFQVRLGSTIGSTQLGGSSLGVSAAITTASGVTNKWWELKLDIICYTPGQGSGATTLICAGYVASPGGFASPFVYALEPTTPDTATWTQTIDNSVTQYFNLSVTCSASSASNTIQCKQAYLLGFN